MPKLLTVLLIADLLVVAALLIAVVATSGGGMVQGAFLVAMFGLATAAILTWLLSRTMVSKVDGELRLPGRESIKLSKVTGVRLARLELEALGFGQRPMYAPLLVDRRGKSLARINPFAASGRGEGPSKKAVERARRLAQWLEVDYLGGE